MISAPVIVTDVKSRKGRKLLRSVSAGECRWRMTALPRVEWRIAFARDDSPQFEHVTDVRVRHESLVTDFINGTDPASRCSGVWLLGSDAATAARLILDDWSFRVRSFSPDNNGTLTLECLAIPPWQGTGLTIGGATVYRYGEVITGGACSA